MTHEAFEILSALYPEDISFLQEEDSFRFLIMVMLSAQTTDERVMNVSPRLFALYPDASSLASAEQVKVERIIRPLGFFKMKSRNIIATSREIVTLGYIPNTIEELVKLPGVGRKTANCYIEHVLKAPAVIVDTHFKRVAYRLGYSESTEPEQVEKDIREGFEEKEYTRVSMVLNAFGRDICHARGPQCEKCPVSLYCKRR